VACSSCEAGVCLEGLWKTMSILTQVCRMQNVYSNSESFEYEVGVKHYTAIS
jgi:hypothetical protein